VHGVLIAQVKAAEPEAPLLSVTDTLSRTCQVNWTLPTVPCVSVAVTVTG
jgi:hypothetical protein